MVCVEHEVPVLAWLELVCPAYRREQPRRPESCAKGSLGLAKTNGSFPSLCKFKNIGCHVKEIVHDDDGWL